MLFVLKGSKTQVCKALVLYKDTAECQKGEGRSFSVPFSCPLCTYSCHFSSAVMSPPPQFLSLCCFFCGDPKTCCHKKGIASLAQFVLQKAGSFSRSPMLQLIGGKSFVFCSAVQPNTSASSSKPHIWKWHRHCPSV